MSGIRILGYGVVSPAGWGREAFHGFLDGRGALARGEWVLPDGQRRPAFRVPPRPQRAAWQGHARLRRASPVSHFAVAAVMEALEMAGGAGDPSRLGVVSCVMGGSVQYSRRFYAEVLADPSTASPLLFPETVFNAPASHIGALLGARSRNDTLVSDETGVLAGLLVGAEWLESGWVDRCLVVCAGRRLDHGGGIGGVRPGSGLVRGQFRDGAGA